MTEHDILQAAELCYNRAMLLSLLESKEVKTMDPKEKTPEEIRQEMIEQMQKSDAQFLQEIAIPGIVQPVDTTKL